jgi:predicted alpha-1,2-mannosidase
LQLPKYSTCTIMRVIIRFLVVSCMVILITPLRAQERTPFEYVNPLIGTGGHGHTYPGATVPFGMVQLSPDTRLDGWDGCSGYHYSDSIIYGFSHTHLNGTGCSDYGDILIMPATGDILMNNGADGQPGYCSHFKHSSEHAEPGYYSVFLENPGIKAELTATARTGFHSYTFPESSQANIIIDLVHRDEVISSSLKVISNSEIEGMRRSRAWAEDQHVYFVARFSKPFTSNGIAVNNLIKNGLKSAEGKHLKAYFQFETKDGEKINVKIGISGVSTEGARKNLESEIPGWDFEKVRADASSTWKKALGRINVSGGSEDQKTVFYTALYHTMINPVLASDIDGSYRGRDLEIHKATGYNQYTVFSLWDTYRAFHPLMTIIDQKRTTDFIETFLAQYDQGGLLPVWELSGNETNCMIGYHSVSVIADAYLKGIRGFDAAKALESMKKSASQDKSGLNYYKKQGFIPSEHEHESVSKTLEYAYDDWCIAQMAQSLGKMEDFTEFIRRGQNYKNVFDPQTGFMRARYNGGWYSPFAPGEVNNNYTEANSWQYSFACPQDIDGLMKLLGGKDKLSSSLDELFAADTRTSGRVQSDITGLIGQYAHGNEPSHHIAYLYNYVGQPYKTQALVHKIMSEFYTPNPDGLIGNEDCGQMSAWAVLSAMGFYPVTPGNDIYTIGTPYFGMVTIHLENGNKFVIKANNLSKDNYYIQSASINGKVYLKSFLKHGDIMQGGELVFEMGPKPSAIWGVGENNMPHTGINENLILPTPYLSEGSRTFSNTTSVALTAEDGATIDYSIDSSGNVGKDFTYTKPFIIDKNCKLKFSAKKNGYPRTPRIISEFLKVKSDKDIHLNTLPAPQYSGDGPGMLTDGLRGNDDFRLGGWQGYEAVNVDVVIDLRQPKIISTLAIGFLQDINSWIFMPSEVGFFLSLDGITYKSAGVVKNDIPQDKQDKIFKDFTLQLKLEKARYIHVVAKNIGACPPGHKGNGAKAWIFTDEIIVE